MYTRICKHMGAYTFIRVYAPIVIYSSVYTYTPILVPKYMLAYTRIFTCIRTYRHMRHMLMVVHTSDTRILSYIHELSTKNIHIYTRVFKYARICNNMGTYTLMRMHVFTRIWKCMHVYTSIVFKCIRTYKHICRYTLTRTYAFFEVYKLVIHVQPTYSLRMHAYTRIFTYARMQAYENVHINTLI